jgi:hypothetical protein
MVANAGVSLNYPDATIVCTTPLPAGQQQLVLNWARGSEGLVAATATAADGTEMAYAACEVSLGVPNYCYTRGPFNEAQYVVTDAGLIGVTGFFGRLSLSADTTVTLTVSPNGVGGSTPWITWEAGSFRVGAL